MRGSNRAGCGSGSPRLDPQPPVGCPYTSFAISNLPQRIKTAHVGGAIVQQQLKRLAECVAVHCSCCGELLATHRTDQHRREIDGSVHHVLSKWRHRPLRYDKGASRSGGRARTHHSATPCRVPQTASTRWRRPGVALISPRAPGPHVTSLGTGAVRPSLTRRRDRVHCVHLRICCSTRARGRCIDCGRGRCAPGPMLPTLRSARHIERN